MAVLKMTVTMIVKMRSQGSIGVPLHEDAASRSPT
jgi:hypothetical protein